jgi:SSS family solute:Na+ symporter
VQAEPPASFDARTWIVLAVAGAWLVLNLVVGVAPTRKSSPSAAGFVAGDRALGLLLMYFITGATIFSAFAFLGLPGMAARQGAAGYYILAYGVLGFVPFYFLGPRAARLGRAHGFVTQAEMVAARFGMRSLAGLIAVVSLIAFVPYVALQIQGAGTILTAMTHGALPGWAGGLIVYAVVTVYVTSSGLLGVGWTNVLQGVLMLSLAWGLGLYLPHALYGGVGEMFERIATERPELLRAPGLAAGGKPWSWGEYSSNIVVSSIGFSFWPHLFMKAFTARDDRTLRRTVVLYPTFMLFLVPILLIGFSAVLYEPAAPSAEMTLPHMLMRMDLPAVLVGLFCAGGLAAAMGGDAISHAAASIGVRDGLVTALGARLEPERERRLIRVGIVLVMLASYVVAVWPGNRIVPLLLFAYGPITQLAPAVVAALYARRATGPGVLAGLIAGIAVNLTLVAWRDLRPWDLHPGICGLIVNVLVLVVVSRATSGRGERDDAWFLVAGGTDPAAGALRDLAR